MIITTTVNADSLELLLMPGKVVTAHEKYEQDCDQCHDTSNKVSQDKLCVQCHAHENIADDLLNKTGFHGRLSSQTDNDCKHCHTDHEGRSANIVLLNTSTFEHDNTDFLLKGIHKVTSCTACHKSDKKYSEAATDCYSCHKTADIHKGKQGEKCADCHNTKGWKKTSFNHEKTDFPLKGAHKETLCAACHINQKYEDTPKTCNICHQINDIHLGNFGEKCNDCHNTKQWDKVTFNHDKETDFSLSGQHQKTSCNSCHRNNQLKPDKTKQKTPTKCYDCHNNDDSHKTRYGKKCDDCHTTTSWKKSKFDHTKDTKFELFGKHKKTTCNQCHKGHLYNDELTTLCINCHKQDDIHKGKQGKQCGDCHNEKGWRSNVIFDHDLTKFPLIGMHATTQCEECHLSSNYSDTESSCNQCHSDDDVHETKLGTDCASCHNPNSWNTWLFDHEKNSTFKIDGAHKKVGCYDCHQTESNGKLKSSKDCISCHRSRDIHNRSFGRQCGDCHSTENFRDINIKR